MEVLTDEDESEPESEEEFELSEKEQRLLHEAYDTLPHREKGGYIAERVRQQIAEPLLRMLAMFVLWLTSSLTSRTAGLSCAS